MTIAGLDYFKKEERDEIRRMAAQDFRHHRMCKIHIMAEWKKDKDGAYYNFCTEGHKLMLEGEQVTCEPEDI